MSLKNLKLKNFRNYESAQFQLDPGITIFTGSNGVGKTSILESISLLGSARSFRSGKNENFIRQGEETATLSAKIESLGLENELRLEILPNGKRMYQNDKLVRKMHTILPILPSIVFSPADHGIIEGDAGDRKQFLNRAISNVSWGYAETLTKFNQVLAQRNQLLKRLSDHSLSNAQTQLDVWDEQFFQLGLELMQERNQYLKHLNPLVTQEYLRISQKEELFTLKYCALSDEKIDADFKDQLEIEFRIRVKDSLRRDLAVGSTSIGPHKDEILLTLNGNKVKFYGSQGEKRTSALALRLGEVSYFREKMNRTPVLLIDDVSSELDSNRRQSLVELLRREDAQVLITATELPTTMMQDLERNIVHWDLTNLGDVKDGDHGKNFQ